MILNRIFWKTVKPFLTSMSCMRNDCIRIEKDGDIIRDEKLFVEIFLKPIKILQKYYLSRSHHLWEIVKTMQRKMLLLTKLYQNTVLIPVSKKLKREFSPDKEFELDYANDKDINQIIKSLNVIQVKKIQMEFLLSLLKFQQILLIVVLQVLSKRIFLLISILIMLKLQL